MAHRHRQGRLGDRHILERAGRRARPPRALRPVIAIRTRLRTAAPGRDVRGLLFRHRTGVTVLLIALAACGPSTPPEPTPNPLGRVLISDAPEGLAVVE